MSVTDAGNTLFILVIISVAVFSLCKIFTLNRLPGAELSKNTARCLLILEKYSIISNNNNKAFI